MENTSKHVSRIKQIKDLQRKISKLSKEVNSQKNLVLKWKARCISKDALIESMQTQMQRVIKENTNV